MADSMDDEDMSQGDLLSGWGRTSPVACAVAEPDNRSDLQQLLGAPETPIIARGLGRSYGDAAQIVDGTAVALTRFKTAEWLDADAGVLHVGGGTTVAELIDRYVPQGWFVPVTPGTRMVTVGGAIAADIHGKNHHRDGSWCNFVDSITLMVANGQLVRASRETNPMLFHATCGGMGLTGIIVDATIRMTPITSSTVMVETQRTESLDELMDIMEGSDAEHRFSVAWVDLLHYSARGVLTQGDFATEGDTKRPGTPATSLPPVQLPRVMNHLLVRGFNELWYRKAPSEPTVTDQSITAFFHPLDAIRDWNRLYGSAGFHQWQIALPEGSQPVLRSIAKQLRDAKAPAFFAVLKRFGPGNDCPLSFPMAGWTLALDLPAGNLGTTEILDELDREVVDNGGRIYLAKDARMNPALLPRMYPRLEAWKAVRNEWDPTGLFASDLSRRLGL